ncbi:MAG: hypothetical protein ABIS69_02720 [Sediminibacterium sp.]
MNLRKINPLIFIVVLVTLFTSCAAAGNMIEHKTWVGMLDLAVAGAIALFIFRGNK